MNFSGWQCLVDLLIIQTYNFSELNVSKHERPFLHVCLNWLKYYHIIWLLVLLSLTGLSFNAWRVQTWGSLLFEKIPLRFIWKYSEFFRTGSICANIWVLSYVIVTQIPSPTSQKKKISKWENLGFFQGIFWILTTCVRSTVEQSHFCTGLVYCLCWIDLGWLPGAHQAILSLSLHQ